MEAIRDGSLHRVRCEQCGLVFRADASFSYTDIENDFFVRVMPRRKFFQWKGASADLRYAGESAGPRSPQKPSYSVVFGLTGLRERIIARDHRIDPQNLELLKVAAISEHPFLIRKRGLDIRLDSVDDAGASLIARHRHGSRVFRVSIPRVAFDEFLHDQPTIDAWMSSVPGEAFGPEDDDWADLRRWSPASWSLAALEYYARVVESGQPVDTASGDFKKMLKHLPHGEHLPSLARSNLRIVRRVADEAGDVELQDALFEIRFGVGLEDEWGQAGTDADITTLWEILRVLPQHHIVGNASVDEIQIGTVANDSSWYDPSTLDIQIHETDVQGGRDWFASTVRHEVGHAVEERKLEQVENWLWSDVRWGWYDEEDSSIDAWMEQLGGWGDLEETEKGEVREILRHCLGPGNVWTPPPPPNVPDGHVWNSDGFAPREVFEATPAHWYEDHGAWYRDEHYAYFINFQYRLFQMVPLEVLDFIDQHMPYDYAAMSHSEFFAELYAAHFDPNRTDRPDTYTSWLDANLL